MYLLFSTMPNIERETVITMAGFGGIMETPLSLYIRELYDILTPPKILFQPIVCSNLVFSTNIAQTTIGWNGQKNNSGQNQPSGVFMYEAILVGPRGKPHNYKGYVTLIR